MNGVGEINLNWTVSQARETQPSPAPAPVATETVSAPPAPVDMTTVSQSGDTTVAPKAEKANDSSPIGEVDQLVQATVEAAQARAQQQRLQQLEDQQHMRELLDRVTADLNSIRNNPRFAQSQQFANLLTSAARPVTTPSFGIASAAL